MLYKIKKKFWRHFLTMFIIIPPIVPLVILDLFMEIYHQIGFRLCQIPVVKRSNYVKVDRHRLRYLNWFDKLGCAYCGYANGLAAYWVKIASLTEIYWCGIKHKKTPNFNQPEHHRAFLEYGDEEAYKNKYEKN